MLAIALALTGCRDAVLAMGGAARARGNAEQLFTGLADRFDDVARNRKYEYARVSMSRGALAPSSVFGDTATWTGSSRNVRQLETSGAHAAGRYTLTAGAGAGVPVLPGDARHLTSLTRLTDDEFRWQTDVDFALGTVRPADVALVVSRLIAAGEGRSERAVRADLAATMPRTSAILGAAFSLDSVRPTPLVDGSTMMTVGIAIHSDRLRRRYPALGEYVRKYVDPAQYRFVLADRAGAPFLEAAARDRFLVIRVRTMRGRMVPLVGPARPMPDSLRLLADFTVKVKLFTVGFHDLSMDFVNESRGDRERAWSVTAQREPKWDLPFITARLLRAPLRRPFAGEGAAFRLGIRGGEAEGPTMLTRQARLVVQESPILRFLNSLTSSAMDDFGARVELEQNAWLRELFLAMREDARG